MKPREKAELTPAQRRRNWWHYHKWHVGIGVVLVGIAVSLGCSVLGIGQVKPDYQVAYVGENPLPDGAAVAIEEAFASLGDDLNGDGKVVVRLNQYASGGDPGLAASAEVQLMADILDCESYFFLLEDPEQFQASYHSLSRLDGSWPEEGDDSARGTYLGWNQCPALAAMELGEYSDEVLGKTVTGDSGALASGLYLARRGFRDKKTTAYPDGCAVLWEKLTQGALT